MMRQLAAQHRVTYLTFDDRRSRAGRRGACATEYCTSSCACRARDPPRARRASTPSCARNVCRPLPYAVAKYRSDGYAPASRRGCCATALRRGRLRLPRAGRQRAGRPRRARRCSSAQRRGDDLASGTPRSAANPSQARLLRAAVAAHAALRARRSCARFDHVARRLAAGRGVVRARSIRRADDASHVVPTGVDTEFFAPDGARRGRAAARAGLHRLDGLAAERRRDARTSPTTILPLVRARGARGDAHDRRPQPDAARPRARRAPRGDRTSPAGAATCGRTSRRGAVFVVPLRIGGGTRLKIFEAMAMEQGGRLDDRRRRRAAGHATASDCSRRRPGAVRRRGGLRCCATRRARGALGRAAARAGASRTSAGTAWRALRRVCAAARRGARRRVARRA